MTNVKSNWDLELLDEPRQSLSLSLSLYIYIFLNYPVSVQGQYVWIIVLYRIYEGNHTKKKTGGFVSFLWKILHFQIFFLVPNTFWWLLNFERYMHVYLSFCCIFLICSCHLSNHPSICELFYIQVLMMVIKTETLTLTLHHDIFNYLDYIFSCYLHTVGFYPYLLSYIYIYIYI